jgi:hypothetical protein
MDDFYKARSFKDACRTCGIGESIYQPNNPTKKYAKNHPVSLSKRVPLLRQLFGIWKIYDPKDA